MDPMGGAARKLSSAVGFFWDDVVLSVRVWESICVGDEGWLLSEMLPKDVVR